MGLSGLLNAPLPHEVGCSVLKEVFKAGITFFDTSDAYGQDHDNEIMIAKVLISSYRHIYIYIYKKDAEEIYNEIVDKLIRLVV